MLHVLRDRGIHAAGIQRKRERAVQTLPREDV